MLVEVKSSPAHSGLAVGGGVDYDFDLRARLTAPLSDLPSYLATGYTRESMDVDAGVPSAHEPDEDIESLCVSQQRTEGWRQRRDSPLDRAAGQNSIDFPTSRRT